MANMYVDKKKGKIPEPVRLARLQVSFDILNDHDKDTVLQLAKSLNTHYSVKAIERKPELENNFCTEKNRHIV